MKIIKICSIVIITSAINSHVVNADQSGWKIIGKDLEGGYRSNEIMKYSPLLKEIGIGASRSGKIEETGDNYTYSQKRGYIEVTPAENDFSTDLNNILSPKRVTVLGRCNKDIITDQIECNINIITESNVRGLYQVVDLRGNIVSSCIIGHDFPDRTGAIRIDKNTSFITDVEGCLYGDESKMLQDQLISGKRMIIRYFEWPYDSPKDEEMLISGSFSTALELYKWSHQADLETLFKQP